MQDENLDEETLGSESDPIERPPSSNYIMWQLGQQVKGMHISKYKRK